LFQSHNGAIAAKNIQKKRPATIGFNPTMVRLLHFDQPPLLRFSLLFQSHNGAIAAHIANIANIAPIAMFQSHNGAIAALEQKIIGLMRTMFQSHNGAIAAAQVTKQHTVKSAVSIPQWCDCCPLS